MEAGLAVLLVLTLTLAGRAGLLESGAAGSDPSAERVQTEEKDSLEDVSEKAAEENRLAEKAASEAEETSAEGQYPILGESDVTVQQMVDYFQSSGETYPEKELSEGGADTIETFCQMYYEEAEAEGVRAEVAFAQTMKETGFLQYGGDASIEQFNFAGIGTTGNGVTGNSYPDVRTGIRAQIQHLKAYATADALEHECVDDRYSYVKKGSAPYVEWLGQQENPQGKGWAAGAGYGGKILSILKGICGTAGGASETSPVWYRVRKTWADAKSQKGAFHELSNAKACADENPGYSVFDESGRAVYTGKQSAFRPYLVKVSIPDLNIRKGPGTNYAKTGKYTGAGVFTIVEESAGTGSSKGWGRLKSGAGWVALDYCQKL